MRRLRQLVLERLEVRLPFDASLEPIPLDPFQPDFVDNCELRAEDIRSDDEFTAPLIEPPDGTNVDCTGLGTEAFNPPGEESLSPEDPGEGKGRPDVPETTRPPRRDPTLVIGLGDASNSGGSTQDLVDRPTGDLSAQGKGATSRGQSALLGKTGTNASQTGTRAEFEPIPLRSWNSRSEAAQTTPLELLPIDAALATLGSAGAATGELVAEMDLEGTDSRGSYFDPTWPLPALEWSVRDHVAEANQRELLMADVAEGRDGDLPLVEFSPRPSGPAAAYLAKVNTPWLPDELLEVLAGDRQAAAAESGASAAARSVCCVAPADSEEAPSNRCTTWFTAAALVGGHIVVNRRRRQKRLIASRPAG